MTDSGTPTFGRRRFLAAAGLVGAAVALDACASRTDPPGAASPRPSDAPGPGSPPPASPSASPDLVTPHPIGGRPKDNAVTAENAQRGDPRWDRGRVAGAVEAYLGTPSVGPGERLSLRASGSGTVDVEWYRLGWYGGDGGRLLRTDRGVRLARHPAAAIDALTGMVEAGWPSAIDVPAPTTTVPSGMLLAVVRDRGGAIVANVPVILRPDPSVSARSPVLFVSAAATWQAYNLWGGIDLYENLAGVAVPATRDRRAAVVSFDRPYGEDAGAGLLRRWELQFIRWMERDGRDVEYVADVDLELDPGLADGRRLIVMAGHPEYWSRPMRSRIEAAVATGTSVAFLTANEVYWQARLEAGPGGPGTRIVCYKIASDDPLAASRPSLATCRWREPPVLDPEATLIGQMYGSMVLRPADWIVTEPGHWLYEGTRLGTGDALTNLVGQEFDTFLPDLAPPGTVALARGPVDAEPRPAHDPGALPSPAIHTATAYTAQSGAVVLAAGTFQWSWAIDHYGARSFRGAATPYDERVARMTRNVFDRLGDGALAP